MLSFELTFKARPNSLSSSLKLDLSSTPVEPNGVPKLEKALVKNLKIISYAKNFYKKKYNVITLYFSLDFLSSQVFFSCIIHLHYLLYLSLLIILTLLDDLSKEDLRNRVMNKRCQTGNLSGASALALRGAPSARLPRWHRGGHVFRAGFCPPEITMLFPPD